MSQKRQYEVITERENWTLPFFKASSGFCPFYSPSIFESGAALAHGLDLREERKYRILIIQYMFECGEALQLPYNTICIAIIYFHKFFASISIRAHDPYFISTSCLYTAGKQEETRIRLDRCARFLYDYKHRISSSSQPNVRNPYPSKPELERICKKLSIAELLCTQINKFYYSINLAFDYLLPIISQWKSVYIPHQTNIDTLKYVYGSHAFKFIKQSFYIPINLIIPPQKIAIVCMELSLRLNYEKYRQQQEELTTNETSTEPKYRYIDPPLQWFRIFDVNENEQDLKDEIHLLCNEIIAAVQDVHEFGTKEDIKRCKMWRKNTLKMDTVHKEIVEQQLAHEDRLINNDDDGATEYVMYNMCKELEAKELLSSSSSSILHTVKASKVMKHRHAIHREAEMSLALNNEAISPASLQPHKYFNLYPLKEECFEDVDKEYNEMKSREKRHRDKRNRNKSKDRKKEKEKRHHRNKSHETSSSDEESGDIEMENDENETEEERKSNAIKTNKKRKSKKRKRSESSHDDRDAEKKENKNNHHRKKRRRIEKEKKKKDDDNEDDDESGNSSDHHRVSRKERKSRKRSSSSSSSRHKEKERKRKRKRRSVSPHNIKCVERREREKKLVKKSSKRKENNDKKYTQPNPAKTNRNRYNKNKRNKNRNNKKKNHLMPRYQDGYFSKPHSYGEINAFPYYENMEEREREEVFSSFDYGLTPSTKQRKQAMDGGHESGECTDDQLRLLLSNRKNNRNDHRGDHHHHHHHHGHHRKEFNEEKTQRNEGEQEPISPLLKALKGNNKSQIYTNMFVPSRKDK